MQFVKGVGPAVAAKLGKMGILTVAVVTRPFSFEGNKRMTVARDGMTAAIVAGSLG